MGKLHLVSYRDRYTCLCGHVIVQEMWGENHVFFNPDERDVKNNPDYSNESGFYNASSSYCRDKECEKCKRIAIKILHLHNITYLTIPF